MIIMISLYKYLLLVWWLPLSHAVSLIEIQGPQSLLGGHLQPAKVVTESAAGKCSSQIFEEQREGLAALQPVLPQITVSCNLQACRLALSAVQALASV